MAFMSSMIDPRLRKLAERIDDLIGRSPYTPADIARQVGVDKSAVSRWMSGERTPTMKNLIDLADTLQVEITALWDGPEALPATPEQKAMLQRMGEMTPEQQQAFLALAASIMGGQKS
jgi:transcriptional regulator with XRE-family HTH domain